VVDVSLANEGACIYLWAGVAVARCVEFCIRSYLLIRSGRFLRSGVALLLWFWSSNEEPDWDEDDDRSDDLVIQAQEKRRIRTLRDWDYLRGWRGRTEYYGSPAPAALRRHFSLPAPRLGLYPESYAD